VLEKHSRISAAAVALAALTITSFSLGGSMPAAYSEEVDAFGVEKIYPTANGGNEWYVDMDDPERDPNFRNLDGIEFDENSDGSWQVEEESIRMEVWSPPNEKWLNVEITEYAKMESGSHEVLQLYSRGGHHTSSDECLGSAYKARLYGDGEAAWNKEVTHPAYAGDRGSTEATDTPLADRWIGFKAVMYNFVEDGETYVRMESYIDDDVTDEDGNLVVKNDWKLASVYEDRGGWSADDSDFDSSCGRDRDEVLTQPGGTSTQNIAAFRSDDLTWSFKYLSVREIDPLQGHQTAQQEEEPGPVGSPVQNDNASLCNTESCWVLSNQNIQNDGSITTVSSVDLSMKKSFTKARGTVSLAIVQDSTVLAKHFIGTGAIDTNYTSLTTQFGVPVNVKGNDFDVIVMYEGRGTVTMDSLTIN
jgi:hypothetical protein